MHTLPDPRRNLGQAFRSESRSFSDVQHRHSHSHDHTDHSCRQHVDRTWPNRGTISYDSTPDGLGRHRAPHSGPLTAQAQCIKLSLGSDPVSVLLGLDVKLPASFESIASLLLGRNVLQVSAVIVALSDGDWRWHTSRIPQSLDARLTYWFCSRCSLLFSLSVKCAGPVHVHQHLPPAMTLAVTDLRCGEVCIAVCLPYITAPRGRQHVKTRSPAHTHRHYGVFALTNLAARRSPKTMQRIIAFPFHTCVALLTV